MTHIVYSQTSKDDLLEIWVGLAEINVFAAQRLLDDQPEAPPDRAGVAVVDADGQLIMRFGRFGSGCRSSCRDEDVERGD